MSDVAPKGHRADYLHKHFAATNFPPREHLLPSFVTVCTVATPEDMRQYLCGHQWHARCFNSASFLVVPDHDVMGFDPA